MINRNPTKFALEFFGGSIILLSSQDELNWTEIGLADMGDPDFREMMKDFLAEVSAHGLRGAKVGLFLSQEDVILRTITGDDHETALAQVSQMPVEELSYTVGEPNEQGQKNALFAYRDTLEEAQKFIGQFGFKASYFSARVKLDGFPTQPKIYLKKAQKKAAAIAIWPSLAAAAVVAVGAFSLWASYGSNFAKPEQTIQFSSFSPTPAPAQQAKPILAQKPAATATVVSASIITEEPIVEIGTSIAPIVQTTPQALPKPVVANDASTAIEDVIYDPVPETPIDLAALATRKETMQIDLALPKDLEENTPLALSAVINASATDATDQLPSATAQTVNGSLLKSETELSNDQASSAPANTVLVNDTLERAVPENANYPRPPLRDGKRVVAPDIEPTETVAVQPEKSEATGSQIPRPKLRPNTISASGITVTNTQAAIAKDLVDQAIAADKASLANASKYALGTNKRPPLKSSKFGTLARNLKQPAKPVAAVTAAVTTPTTTATKTTPSAKPSVTAPTRKEKSTGAATTFNKRSLSLVGVFGTPSRRSALFRTSTGSYRSVKIGQRISGWKVVAIGESSAKVSKGSRSKTMRVPN